MGYEIGSAKLWKLILDAPRDDWEGIKTDADFILDSRVSSSLEDKNPGEPPEVDARE